MKHLSDRTVRRLLEVTDLPDLTATKYRLTRKLARGGMGTVYLVEDTELGRTVALKVLSDPDPSSELSERLLREAKHLARLEHPNIVPVHDVGRLPDGRVYYAMKFIRGKRLDEWIGDDIPRPALLRMFQKICEAVAFAHAQGVIHRDLKPENIMVGSFGEAVIMDWGVAKALREAPEEPGGPARGGGEAPAPRATSGPSPRAGPETPGDTAHGVVMGTPAYMAPEQARGEIDRLDERTDLYALGAILYFLLSGRAPGETAGDSAAVTRAPGAGGWAPAAPLRKLRPDVPRPLASLCARAMAERPARRYETAREMADDVDRFLDGRPVRAHRESLPEKAGRILARHQILAYLILAYLLMRLLVLFWPAR